jgi:hypothetical protein
MRLQAKARLPDEHVCLNLAEALDLEKRRSIGLSGSSFNETEDRREPAAVPGAPPRVLSSP